MNKWDVGLTFVLTAAGVMAKGIQLLDVSYNLMRELYEQYNKAFSTHQRQQTGGSVVIRQSHGGSGKQTTSIINDIEADVITLALTYDVDAITERGRVDKEQIERLPDSFAPYTSTIVFLVCKGNPRQIHGQSGLIKPGASVTTPNPKSSSDVHWSYLAAWGYTLHHNNNNQAKAQDFVRALYKNVEVLDSDAHGSTSTFVERGIGNVLIARKSEALLAANELGKDKFEIVTSSESIPAKPTVSVVDKVVEKKGTKEVAGAYLRYPYSSEDQGVVVENYYHPHDVEVTKEYENTFPELRLFTIDKEFGGWTRAQKEHFANGGTFDQISKH